MEIFHSQTGKELWKRVSGQKRKYMVNYSHPIVKDIKRTVENKLRK